MGKAIREFVARYHLERNHQGLGNGLITPQAIPTDYNGTIQRRQRLGGMLNYYIGRRERPQNIKLSSHGDQSLGVAAVTFLVFDEQRFAYFSLLAPKLQRGLVLSRSRLEFLDRTS